MYCNDEYDPMPCSQQDQRLHAKDAELAALRANEVRLTASLAREIEDCNTAVAGLAALRAENEQLRICWNGEGEHQAEAVTALRERLREDEKLLDDIQAWDRLQHGNPQWLGGVLRLHRAKYPKGT